MKKILAVTLLALSFATGFTCSKKAPEPMESAAPAQEQMATPPGEIPPSAPPMDGQPIPPPPPAEAAPAPSGH